MNDERFNMSMRKFLKQVGVTSQQEIERAVREAGKGSGTVKIRATIAAPELKLDHQIEGEIDLG